ncbi:hypothetical protein SGGMMB4_02616 [Sodalis glossinidius str. 'morsitans']|uniref:Uncharacterized protein n=2 Tax=Sodalis glossinidius TaxID=63612 RepID=A0A193QIS7_SODGM|nr:hypothetical protein SGGMMB4_02616 [Sodalis glossinidius str. 'morsitans']
MNRPLARKPISSITEPEQPEAAAEPETSVVVIATPEPAAAQPEPTPVDNTPLRDIETLDKHTVVALAGVRPAINIPRSKLLEIAQQILKYWDILPGIEDRREYGYQLLGSHPDNRHSAKPL